MMNSNRMPQVVERLEQQVEALLAQCRDREAEVARLRARVVELEDEVQRQRESINTSKLERAIESTADYLSSKGERGQEARDLIQQIRREVRVCIDLQRACAAQEGVQSGG